MPRALLALLLCLVFPAAALAEKRVALVIGNAGYVNAAPLKNPANDASDIAEKLERLSFEVIKGIDLDNTGMRRTVKRFADALEGADVAMFFYAGHAVQVNGQNYIAPIDTDLKRETDLDFETISVEFVHRQMERNAKTNILVLDACRDNPLTRRLVRASRSASDGRGLARLDTSGEGTFIVYATEPDNVALDGAGRNSPFTATLLNHIERPGVEISALMTDVRREVYEATDEQQLPWTNSSLLGRFFFASPREPAEASADPAESKRNSRLEKLAAEADAWDAVKDSGVASEIRAFLEANPDGAYAALARFTLERLEADGRTAAAADKPLETARLESGGDTSVSGGKPLDKEAEKQLVRSIQTQLQRVGCDAGKPDGIWGRNSRKALGEFARHGKVDLASLEPEAGVLDMLKQQSGRVCPLSCSAREEERDGRCVAKTCPSGQQLNASGSCVKPAVKTVSRQSAPAAARKPAAKAPSGNCFRFNGKLLCD